MEEKFAAINQCRLIYEAVRELWKTVPPMVKRACLFNFAVAGIQGLHLLVLLLGLESGFVGIFVRLLQLAAIGCILAASCSLMKKGQARLKKQQQKVVLLQIASKAEKLEEQQERVRYFLALESQFARLFDLNHEPTVRQLYAKTRMSLREVRETARELSKLLEEWQKLQE